MLALVSERAGKLAEVVEVEKQIGEIRDRIERMEGQQRRIQNQVQFASIKLELTEESQAQFTTVRRRLRTAFTEGHRAAATNAIAIAFATLRYGPTVVVYSLLLLPLLSAFYRRFRLTRTTMA